MTAYAVNGNTALENLYNGNGQRIQKLVGSDTTNYFYDGDRLLYTTDGNGTLKVLQYYDAYGDLFANTSNDGIAVKQYYYTDDIRGSITNLVDTAKNSVVSYVYTDFGETTQSGSVDNEIRFSGGVYDDESGLYYLNARFYDPASGRFLNPDSYRGEANDPQSLHLYAYCANNPINYVDPSGHKMKNITIARWMVAMPIDLLAGTLGLGLIFAPIKTLCKAGGKAFTKVQFRSSVFKFAQGFQKFGHNIGECVYKALKKVPVVKKNVKRSIVTTVESTIYSFTGKQVVYRFADKLFKNIDIALSVGGLISGILDYMYDKKINNVVYRINLENFKI